MAYSSLSSLALGLWIAPTRPGS